MSGDEERLACPRFVPQIVDWYEPLSGDVNSEVHALVDRAVEMEGSGSIQRPN
jgi:hypothetical protein